MTRILTGLYNSYSDAAAAVRDLEAAGVSTTDISVIASDPGGQSTGKTQIKTGNAAGAGASGGATFGAVVGGASGLMAGLGMLAIPGLGPVVAAGWLAAAAVGAVGGAVVGGAGGGLIGSLVSSGVPVEHANVYAEGVRRGGTIVTVRASDSLAPRVDTILREYRRVDPDVLIRDYRAGGWTQFDENAPPYVSPPSETVRRL